MISTLSTAEAIEEDYDLAEPIKLKWINDLILDNKKVGGVLIKSNS